MQTKSSSASRYGSAQHAVRDGKVERWLGRYVPRVQEAVRAVAAIHPRVADVAVSFPGLLVALAFPCRGMDATQSINDIVNGAPLYKAASAAGVPLWLRRLPPEMFVGAIPRLPDGELFRRQIANHLPRSPKLSPLWLRCVSEAKEWGHEALAVWIARELHRCPKEVMPECLRRISLWAWFSFRSDTRGYGMIERAWRPAMRFATACEASADWCETVYLYLNIGSQPVQDMWLRRERANGFEFEPIDSADGIFAEAVAMKHCLRTYGPDVAHNRCRLWSIRRDGQRIATLRVAPSRSPLLSVVELRGLQNKDAPAEVWWAATRWLHEHELLSIDTKRRDWGTAPLDARMWKELWRPYWLAKQHIPAWLPLAPSRRAIEAL